MRKNKPDCRAPVAGRGFREGRNREGVALIIVLGVLAVLLMAGVAFSISMRTERLGAGSYRFGVGARQLVWVGLARAVEDITVNVAQTNVFTNDFGKITGYLANDVYPNFQVFTSEDWTARSVDNSRVKVVFSDETMEQIPRDLWGPMSQTNSQWLICGESLWPDREEGTVQGWVAYVVANISGYLDMNYVGGSNRAAGADPHEIVLTNAILNEIKDSGKLTGNRNNDARYETIRDFYWMQEDKGLNKDCYPSNFVAYSRFPEGNQVLSNGAPIIVTPFYIGGTVAELEAKQADIVDRLVKSGIALADAPFVFTNLLDYVDEDVVPRRLDSGCTESVPMINEVAPTTVVLNYITGEEGGTFSMTPPRRIRVEWFYPFIRGQTNTTFDIETTTECELARFAYESAANAEETKKMPPYPQTRYSGYKGEANWYGSTDLRGGVGDVSIDGCWPTNRIAVTLRVRCVVYCKEAIGGGPPNAMVDAVPYPTNAIALTWTNSFIVSGLAGGNFDWQPKSLEATDPRVNWDCSSPLCWDTTTTNAGHTIGGVNTKTQERIRRGELQPQRGIDLDTLMHVSNQGQLKSAGELGNLLRASKDPLRTIRLFTHGTNSPNTTPYDNVLAYFTTAPPGVGTRCGLVNPNSMNSNVLASVFVEAPLGYPESETKITVAEAKTLAGAFIEMRKTGSAFTNVADIGRIDFRGTFSNKSDLELESMISYSCGLLGARQNLFTVFVVAGPYSPTSGHLGSKGLLGGDWHGYQRAMAVIWRDPFLNKDGRHECFVQFFRWLGSGD
ncbi:MAG: hypothetical protein QME60_00125 [Verrucomicrobiota bacterium]|nr:hypothetical protein [Verrucomicrobiota bacterium]